MKNSKNLFMDKFTPLIFLDYDGVLQYLSPYPELEPNFQAIRNVIALCEETNAKIIWITDRLEYNYFLPQATWFGGLVCGECDPEYEKSDRLDLWINENFLPNRFCVLDDSYKFQEYYADVHVWIDPDITFDNKVYYEQARRLLV